MCQMNKFHKQIFKFENWNRKEVKGKKYVSTKLSKFDKQIFFFFACLHVMLLKSKDVVISCWRNNNKQERLTIHEHMESIPVFSDGSVLLITLNFWVLLFVSLCSVSFAQCCPWIVHSWLSLQCSLYRLFNTTPNCTFKPLYSRHLSSL